MEDKEIQQYIERYKKARDKLTAANIICSTTEKYKEDARDCFIGHIQDELAAKKSSETLFAMLHRIEKQFLASDYNFEVDNEADHIVLYYDFSELGRDIISDFIKMADEIYTNKNLHGDKL